MHAVFHSPEPIEIPRESLQVMRKWSNQSKKLAVCSKSRRIGTPLVGTFGIRGRIHLVGTFGPTGGLNADTLPGAPLVGFCHSLLLPKSQRFGLLEAKQSESSMSKSPLCMPIAIITPCTLNIQCL